MSDNDLGFRIKNSDESAFAEWYASHSGWVFRKARFMLRCPLDAQEACQDTFVKLWQYRHKWDAERGSFTAFFGSICRSILSHAYHKQRRDNAKGMTGDLDWENDDGRLPDHRDPNAKDPATAVVMDEQVRLIEDTLCEMDDGLMRLSWMLYYFEGYSLADVSRIVDSPVWVVQNRIARTTAHLRESLSK